MGKSIPSTKGRNKREATSSTRSRVRDKVSKTTTKKKRLLRGNSRKTASRKTPSPSTKSKKSRRVTPRARYYRLSEQPNANESEPKTTTKVKRPLQGSSKKRASPKTPRPSIKSKKSKRPMLYGHYHRLKDALSQSRNEAKQDEVSAEPTTSSDYWNSRTSRGGSRPSQLSVKSPKSSH